MGDPNYQAKLYSRTDVYAYIFRNKYVDFRASLDFHYTKEAFAKANPGKVKMGNSGIGAIWHIAALSFEEEFGVQFKHVPYPKGSADIAAALAGKHIDATLADPSVFKSQVDAGNLKILAVMADTRSRNLDFLIVTACSCFDQHADAG